MVVAGDLVAEIDATVQLNKVEASRANLQALEAQLSARESALILAQARLERQTRMMAENATSHDDYDDAVDRLASAQSSLIQLRSQIAQARASLGSDEATLGYSKIYAPIGGTVVSMEMKEGQTLNAVQMAPTIMRIADLGTMTVEAEVSEADVSKLTRGMKVYFTTLGSGERRWISSLRQIRPTPVTENNVVLYTALFDASNDDGALLTGMTAQVFFVTESAYNVLKVPVGALTYVSGASGAGKGSAGKENILKESAGKSNAGTKSSTQPQEGQATGMQSPGSPAAARTQRGRRATVRVIHANGKLETRTIEVGVTSRIAAEVLSGLEQGEEVVAGIVDAPRTGNQPSRRPFGF